MRRVTELDGTEGGRWRVTTRGSSHVFDFTAGTVERFPGPDGTPMPEQGARRLRSIDRCRVGETGFWTLRSNDYLVDYFWHQSSTILEIELLDAVGSEGEETA